jgi:(E)-4-hydroxy-3-methyl-but-2-enyl pyrophosphate reductase
MDILVSEVVGFCHGVEGAVAGVLRQRRPGLTFTLGPLIHNPQVVQRLEEEGVAVRQSLEEFQAGEILVIPAQGAQQTVWEEAARRQIPLLDFTCPELQRTRILLQEAALQGYLLLFLGDAGHAETESLLSFVPEARLLSSLTELEGLALRNKRVALFAQSTQSSELLASFAAALAPLVEELRVFNTICAATRRRQESLRRILPMVEAVVVVGGRNSANTRRLAEVAEREGKRVFYLEKADELQPKWFQGVAAVGVASGASTPASVVEEVVARLRRISASCP